MKKRTFLLMTILTALLAFTACAAPISPGRDIPTDTPESRPATEDNSAPEPESEPESEPASEPESIPESKPASEPESMPESEQAVESETETETQMEEPTPPPLLENPIDPEKPMLALTFDDGPGPYTEKLLDLFVEHGGKATFFVLGNQIDKRPEIVKRITEDGHEIGSHGWDHKQLTKLKADPITEQLVNTRAKIYEVTEVDTPLLRPPYGSYNKLTEDITRELGITMINWSVDTLDWKYRDADTVYNTVMEQAKDGAIILCHDLEKTTVEAMERVIPDLLEQGYQLVTVSELLTIDGTLLEPGTAYRKK